MQNDFTLDHFSTILSRRTSFHCRAGKQLYTKPRKQARITLSEKIDQSPIFGGGLLAVVGFVVSIIVLTF